MLVGPGRNMFRNNINVGINEKNPYGFKCREIRYEQDLPKFNEMLNFFGVSNQLGYILTVSHSWYYAVPGSSILDWTSEGGDQDRLENLKEVTFRDPTLNSYYKNIEHAVQVENLEKSCSGGICIMPGETICDETCIFSKVCDGEVGSPFNPSTQSLPCNKFKLNKNEIFKIG